MDHYDSGKLRSCAQSILDTMKSYTTAKNNIDQKVADLRNNWQDDTNTKYANRYNNEAKVAAENVGNLMKQFAEALTGTAEALEKLHANAQQDIG